MPALGNPDAAGEYPYDPTETFSVEELAHALELRRTVIPHKSVQRRDKCPHVTPCPNVTICLEEIAWYLRHRGEIEL